MQRSLHEGIVVTCCLVNNFLKAAVEFMPLRQMVKETRDSLLYPSILMLSILYVQTTTLGEVLAKVFYLGFPLSTISSH